FRVRQILNWSPQSIDIPSDLADVLDEGIANAGAAFHVLKPNQLTFLITFLRHWKSLAEEERAVLLTDPWQFKEEVWKLPINGAQTQREALLHLVYPDVFEGITSQDWKAQIA